jgi:hypothetical protein
MDRRNLVMGGVTIAAGTLLGRAALAQQPMNKVGADTPNYSPGPHAEPFSKVEIVRKASSFFGSTTQGIAGAIEHVFQDQGEPTGYIAGTEGSGAVGVGLRYGKGVLYMKHHRPVTVYWQGPSIGWDFGADAARVFTLVYKIDEPSQIFHRFPGVDGSIYVVAGVGVNYQAGEGLTLAPIRTGVGARAGASVGYLDYSRKRHILPF